jgi:hypothetical protein
LLVIPAIIFLTKWAKVILVQFKPKDKNISRIIKRMAKVSKEISTIVSEFLLKFLQDKRPFQAEKRMPKDGDEISFEPENNIDPEISKIKSTYANNKNSLTKDQIELIEKELEINPRLREQIKMLKANYESDQRVKGMHGDYD